MNIHEYIFNSYWPIFALSCAFFLLPLLLWDICWGCMYFDTLHIPAEFPHASQSSVVFLLSPAVSPPQTPLLMHSDVHYVAASISAQSTHSVSLPRPSPQSVDIHTDGTAVPPDHETTHGVVSLAPSFSDISSPDNSHIMDSPQPCPTQLDTKTGTTVHVAARTNPFSRIHALVEDPCLTTMTTTPPTLVPQTP